MRIFKCARCGEECAVPEDVYVNEDESVICDDCYQLLYGGVSKEVTVH